MEENMPEQAIDLVELGAASELTLGIKETDAVEDLNGEDYRD